jgi:hypothetical protein
MHTVSISPACRDVLAGRTPSVSHPTLIPSCLASEHSCEVCRVLDTSCGTIVHPSDRALDPSAASPGHGDPGPWRRDRVYPGTLPDRPGHQASPARGRVSAREGGGAPDASHGVRHASAATTRPRARRPRLPGSRPWRTARTTATIHADRSLDTPPLGQSLGLSAVTERPAAFNTGGGSGPGGCAKWWGQAVLPGAIRRDGPYGTFTDGTVAPCPGMDGSRPHFAR